jgi:hypothetical protein
VNAKALTVQQPHARDMTHDGKRLENRSWYTHHREEMQVLKQPVPCKGALGIWELPPDVEAECRRQL